MTKSLWSRLVAPLGLLSVVALALHAWWDYDGLLVNLATGLLTIIVTVSYVDWILRRHESERWSGTDVRISDRLEVFVNGVVSGIRDALGFSPEIMNLSLLSEGGVHRMHQEVLRVAEHVQAPATRARVGGLDESGWRALAQHLESVETGAERLLDRFSYRLSPTQIEILLDIQKAARGALTFYQVFPDLAGVPAERLPQTRTPPTVLQAAGYDSTAKELQELLGLAKELANAQRDQAGGTTPKPATP